MIVKKVIIVFVYLCVLLRPVMPVIAAEIYEYSHATSSQHHSWLVLQLLKGKDHEKQKIPNNIKIAMEASSMIVYDLLFLSPLVPTTVRQQGSVVDCKLIFQHASPIFQPPKSAHFFKSC